MEKNHNVDDFLIHLKTPNVYFCLCIYISMYDIVMYYI